MHVLRTPDERFDGLPAFPFEPKYAMVRDPDGGELRMHHLDEGPSGSGETVVLLHGEPSWSFLYRHMIPVLTEAGHRCIAPDLIGFGRSDKPSEREDYSYARHVEWVRELLFDRLDLHRITLVAQDWGGLIGLRLVAEHPERFSRVVTANTFLPTGDEPPSDVVSAWQKFARETPEFPVAQVIKMGCAGELDAAVLAGYEAPFPEERFTAGARQFPTLIPTTPDNPASAANRAAWEVLRRFDKPFLCAFSDRDPITAGSERPLIREIPGAAGQPHTTIEGAGHFLQEERGPELARVVASFIEAT